MTAPSEEAPAAACAPIQSFRFLSHLGQPNLSSFRDIDFFVHWLFTRSHHTGEIRPSIASATFHRKRMCRMRGASHKRMCLRHLYTLSFIISYEGGYAVTTNHIIYQTFSGLSAAKCLIEQPQFPPFFFRPSNFYYIKKLILLCILVQWKMLGQNLHYSFEPHLPSIACTLFSAHSLRGEKQIMRIPI